MHRKDILEALKKLRESEKRKFNQSVDLIVNLKSFDVKRESVNLFLHLPHKVKDVKMAAFLEKNNSAIDTIPRADFDIYKDKKKIKVLIKKYDFFLSSAKLMPAVATTFGRYLGPVGKMPNPQLGVIKDETEKEIQELMNKISKVIKIKSKEPSLKFSIGKENMSDEAIADNVEYAFNNIFAALPKAKENLKSVMIKFTMTKPVKVPF